MLLLLAIGSSLLITQASADDLDSVLPSLLEKADAKETFVGELHRVQRRDGEQRLALVDKGKVVAFLAPTPRISLREHMGSIVGVVSRNYASEPGQPPTVIADEVKTASQILADEGYNESDLSPVTSPVVLQPIRHPRFQEPIGNAVRQPAIRQSVRARQPSRSTVSRRPSRRVRQASFESPIQQADAEIMEGPVGEGWDIVHEGAPVFDGYAGEGYIEGGPGYVDQVISGSCGTSCVTGNCGQCTRCGPAGRLWVRAEYLLWWGAGMNLPPLVTSSNPGTPIGNAGILGLDSTSILLGNDEVLDEGQAGFRVRFGGMLGRCGKLRWEGEYLTLGEEAFRFSQRSDGNGSPILARPFFNINPRNGGTGALEPPAREDAELVAFPGVLSGIVSVDALTEFDSAGGRLLWTVCCKELCRNRATCGGCCQQSSGGYSQISMLGGYRYANLRDTLTIREDLTSLDPNNPSRFEITDRFRTENEFHGGEFGFLWQGGNRRLSLESYSKVAIGNVHQTVDISGNTIISFAGPQDVSDGGLLTQASNIGEYSRDRLGVLPEFGANLGWYITPRLQATVGYTFLFLSSVVRPGDQIDLDVNPDQLAPAIDPIEGPLRPRFAFRETDYWAHGLNVGLDLRW